MLRTAAALGILLALLLYCSCSVSSLAGGTSTTGNSVVTGVVIDTNGNVIEGAVVKMLATDYNPCTDGPVSKSKTDTTDADGCYKFFITDTSGVFNIEGTHVTSGTKVLIKDIGVQKDTTIVPMATLREPGELKIFLPDFVDQENGYFYIPGTTCALYLIDVLDFVMMDSIPTGMMPSIIYGSRTSSSQEVIRYYIPVISKETAIVTMPTWKYSQRLLFNTAADGAGVSGNVMNFPVLVRLSSVNFDFSQAQAGGGDIRFTKDDNSLLLYEIENWDMHAERAAIWVKIDTVYGNNSNQKIHMTWGNPKAAGMSNSSAVFDTAHAYRAVWHFNRDCQDATENKYTGANYGTDDTVGIIGHSRKFDGADSIRVTGLAGKPTSISVSAWAHLHTANGEYGSEVVSLGNAILIRMDDIRGTDTLGTMASYSTDSVHRDFRSKQLLAKSGWHHIVFTIDPANARQFLYIDGILYNSDSLSTPIDYAGNDIGQNIVFGVHGNNAQSYPFTGLIDEVRISRVAYSYDYIKLCYMNQKIRDELVEYK